MINKDSIKPEFTSDEEQDIVNQIKDMRINKALEKTFEYFKNVYREDCEGSSDIFIIHYSGELKFDVLKSMKDLTYGNYLVSIEPYVNDDDDLELKIVFKKDVKTINYIKDNLVI